MHPHAVAHWLAGIGAIGTGGAALSAVRVWPRGADGFVVLLHGQDGSRWGAVEFGDQEPPEWVLAGCDRGDVWRLRAPGGFAWRHASDPALAIRRACGRKAAGVLAMSGHGDCLPGRVEVLSYKPLQRSVLRYPRAGGPALIAKLYGGQRDEFTALAHAGVRKLGPSPDAPVCILHPVSRIREWRALLWPTTDGTTLHAQLARPEAARLGALAGVALACLHAGSVEWTRLHRRDDELAGLEIWVRLAARAWPDLRERLLAGFAGLRQRATTVGEGPLVPSHRDFHDKQLLFHEDGVSILDLDLACLAEPELDIGNLLAHLRLRVHQGRLAAGSALPRAFLDGYLGTNGSVEPARILFYQSCARLRLACVYALRPRWASLVPRLIDDASGGGGHCLKEKWT